MKSILLLLLSVPAMAEYPEQSTSVSGSSVTAYLVSGASVSVTFPSAQPVSVASLPLPSNAASETGGNLATIVTNTNKIPTSPATDRATAASPASCRLSDGSGFYAGATETTAAALNTKVTACNTGATVVTTLPATPAGTNRIGSMRMVDSADADLTTTKGVQSSRFVGVQDITDSGRTLYIATGSLTGATAEAIVTMGVFRAGVSAVGATSLTVTSGKTLRLTSWCLTWINRTAAAGGAFAVMRMMATGNTTVTSPAISVLGASSALATVNAATTSCAPFPQGVDLTGNMTWGVSHAAIGAVAGSSITVQGYEF